MSDSDYFDLVYVNEAFRDSLRDEDDVDTLKYIEGYRELMKFLNLLGAIFSFVTSDVKSKIKIMEQHLSGADAHNYATFRKMMKFEKESGLHEKHDFVSGSRTMLRLHRGLDFIRLFLKEISEGDENANTCTVCQKAYSHSLAQFHPWYIRNAAMLAMYALPARQDFLKKIFGTNDVLQEVITILPEALKTCDEIYSRVDESYTFFDFHGLP